MNISNQIPLYDSNYSYYPTFYSTEWGIGYFYTFSVTYIVHILLSFPINLYVIWLIVRGTGNGLLAEISILNLSVCEILLCVHSFLMFMYWFLYDVEVTIKLLYFFYGFSVTGCPLFMCLICVERYMAVVHPLIFLKFKPLRYRLICSIIAWGTCFCSCIFYEILVFYFWDYEVYMTSIIAQFFIFVSIQLFCCLAVLRALKRSGPGERGRQREEENHKKRRAFHLILITTVGMVFTYGSQTILQIVSLFIYFDYEINQSISYVCILFAGLVQPLLFLYRVGKLNFIKCH